MMNDHVLLRSSSSNERLRCDGPAGGWFYFTYIYSWRTVMLYVPINRFYDFSANNG